MSLASGWDSTQIWFCCSHAPAHFSQQVYPAWPRAEIFHSLVHVPPSRIWSMEKVTRSTEVSGAWPIYWCVQNMNAFNLGNFKSTFKKLWLFQLEPYRLSQSKQQEDIPLLVQAQSPHYPHLNHILSQELSTVRSLHFIMECISFHEYSILT